MNRKPYPVFQVITDDGVIVYRGDKSGAEFTRDRFYPNARVEQIKNPSRKLRMAAFFASPDSLAR